MTPRDRAHRLVTGGAGYLGTAVVDELIAAGHSVRILDVLMHGQHELARELERRGIDVHEGDVRDSKARLRALSGVGAVVHLGAIDGDPACAQDPALSQSVNVDGEPCPDV